MNRLIIAVQLWAIDKGLDTAGPAMQFMKMSEELGEVAQAYTRNNQENLLMELGDLFVTAIIFCQQNGIEPADALGTAYEKINGRSGKLVNGSFVKVEDLDERD